MSSSISSPVYPNVILVHIEVILAVDVGTLFGLSRLTRHAVAPAQLVGRPATACVEVSCDELALVLQLIYIIHPGLSTIRNRPPFVLHSCFLIFNRPSRDPARRSRSQILRATVVSPNRFLGRRPSHVLDSVTSSGPNMRNQRLRCHVDGGLGKTDSLRVQKAQSLNNRFLSYFAASALLRKCISLGQFNGNMITPA